MNGIFYILGDLKNPKECLLIDKLIALDNFQLYTCTNKSEKILFKNGNELIHLHSRDFNLNNFDNKRVFKIKFDEKLVTFEFLKKLLL